jgi:hypothetical protein
MGRGDRRPLEDVVEDADEPGCRQVGAEGTVGLASADELLDPPGRLGVELPDPPGREDRLRGLEHGVGVGDQPPARLDQGAQRLAWVAGEIKAAQHRLAALQEPDQGGLDERLAGGEVAVDGDPAQPGRLGDLAHAGRGGAAQAGRGGVEDPGRVLLGIGPAAGPGSRVGHAIGSNKLDNGVWVMVHR